MSRSSSPDGSRSWCVPYTGPVGCTSGSHPLPAIVTVSSFDYTVSSVDYIVSNAFFLFDISSISFNNSVK